MLKAAVFDFNGTLFWDTPYHNRAFRILAEKYSTPSPEGLRSRRMEDSDLSFIQGRTNNFIMRYMFGEAITDRQVADLGEEKEQIYRDLCKGEVVFAPGDTDTADCCSRCGFADCDPYRRSRSGSDLLQLPIFYLCPDCGKLRINPLLPMGWADHPKHENYAKTAQQ